MEFLWIFAVVAGFGFISWVYNQIQEYLERERSRQRDEIAVNVIDEYGLSNEDKTSVDQLFSYVVKNIPRRVEETEEYEIVAPVRKPNLSDQLCPKCHMGFLVRRQGRYGSFLGCSRYPSCKTTKPVGWINHATKAEAKKAKEAQKAQYSKKFMEDLNKAYN